MKFIYNGTCEVHNEEYGSHENEQLFPTIVQ